jgi:hypothetical protein
MTLLSVVLMCVFGLLACVGLALTMLQATPSLWFQIFLAMIAIACFAIALGVWQINKRT